MENVSEIKDQAVLKTEQEKTRTEIIQALKKYRKEKGITQQELAARSGVAQPNITRFESCRYNPTLDFVVRVADALDLDIEISFKERKSSKKTKRK